MDCQRCTQQLQGWWEVLPAIAPLICVHPLPAPPPLGPAHLPQERPLSHWGRLMAAKCTEAQSLR